MTNSFPSNIARAYEVAQVIEAGISGRTYLLPSLNHFPRDMAKLASHAFDIPIIAKPDLSVHSVAKYLCVLSGSKYALPIPSHERRLFGLLHVGPPANMILIDADLPARTANYVIAHELAHFFGDVLVLRQQWLAQLPDQSEEIRKAFEWRPYDGILDLQALIRGLPPRPRPILARGSAESLETETREVQADLVARELLAPWRTVFPLALRYSQSELIMLLRTDYGLPSRIACSYADELHYARNPVPDLIDRLFGTLDK